MSIFQWRISNICCSDSWLEKCSESSKFVHKFAGSKCLFSSEGYQTFIVQKAGLKNVQNPLTLCTQRERCVESIKALLLWGGGGAMVLFISKETYLHRPRVCWVAEKVPSRWTHWWCCPWNVEDLRAWERGLAPQDTAWPGRLRWSSIAVD
jgi:hypothetical protein